MTIDPKKIRADFPALTRRVHGRPLAYLDNAATTHKPRAVLEAISDFYSTKNSNIHRGVHTLSEEASAVYEEARETMSRILGAAGPEEVIFTSGTTAAINLVAASFGRAFVSEGDEIIVSELEHHSNLIPWQMLCRERKAKLRVIPMDESGGITRETTAGLMNKRTRLVALTCLSNVLGTAPPVREIIRLAHEREIPVLLDAAQAAPHLPLSVRELDCDFLAFSGHKMYGPTGIGVLYGKKRWLEVLPPWQTGGGMIASVRLDETEFAEPPFRFEAGTPHIAGAVGLKAAVEYIRSLGSENIRIREREVMDLFLGRLRNIPGIILYGGESPRTGVVSFNLEGIDPYDAGLILDGMGVAVRTGSHCAEPLLRALGLRSTMRASIALYTDESDIEALIRGLEQARKMLG